ncbi:DsbA family protein [Aliidiomarina sanyensis]|uniref:DSBA-like thioredoxin domain-containing protein n=1 Tax=Aliidiomarina sanyensis TaxID=1249555 RepID=A0A432WG03_9GAMM|nr:DsbA family protein [Aliidiomarina sanyensis]RUO32730.1 hypothetical protein CWE11_08125 [Aliidiomarina sanyensis]
MIRQWLSAAVLAAVTVFFISACSEAPDPEASGNGGFVTGKHYLVLDYPVQQGNTEPFLVEYLWVGCPYCQRIEPILQAYKDQHPEVSMVRIHGALTQRWTVDGSIFHALEMKAERDIAPEMLEFYASKAPDLPDGEDLTDFIESLGFDPDEVFAMASSAEVAGILETSFNDMQQNNIRGVPAIVVNGRYVLANPLPEDIVSDEDYFALLNYLLTRD